MKKLKLFPKDWLNYHDIMKILNEADVYSKKMMKSPFDPLYEKIYQLKRTSSLKEFCKTNEVNVNET